MRDYEMMLITRPALSEEEQEALRNRVSGLITEHGGTLQKLDVWGRRKLAYPIKHQADGFYAVFNFSGDNELVAELDRVLSITDEVLRFKIFLMEKR